MMMPDGTIWAVNVRGDGYIVGGTGEFLAEECTAREKVEALIFQGEEAPIKVENKESFPTMPTTISAENTPICSRMGGGWCAKYTSTRIRNGAS